MSTSTVMARHATDAGGQRVTLPRVVRMEWIKFWSLRSTMYTLAVTVVLVIGIGLIISSVIGSGEGPDADDFGDPTSISLGGLTFASLAIATLGVLMSAGEYATGTIRATLAAVPARLPVLWAKVVVFATVAFGVMLPAVLGAFLAGQAILSSRGMESAALTDSGVLGALAGSAGYLTGAGLIGLALGALLRNTAASITTVVGTLFLLPGVFQLLPQSWNDNVGPYLPSNAAAAFMSVTSTDGGLSAGAGLAVFAGYLAVLLVAAAGLLKRRDA
jgi:ABC-2 type transport system permease protein